MSEYEKPRKKHTLNNFDFCYGQGANWYDIDTGKLYLMQEYKEALDKGEKPKGIRVVEGSSYVTVGYIEPEKLRMLMEDPEPDPRY